MSKFHPVSPQVDLPAMEQDVLRFWKSADVFGQAQKQTAARPRYVFFEGPPTANGRPGIHHVLARAFKDIFPRYKTMRGFYVSRKGGWDTHGLPVELEVEKKLGFSGKKAIEEYGVAPFIQKCRQSVFEYVEEWEKMTERLGYWVDLPTAYVTLTNDYVESLWWILKQYWERGLIYQGYKVVPYCPRCGTPLSSHELAQGYKEGTQDPSVFVKFPLRDLPGQYLLVWTTTPWTLPGNVAVAVGEEIDYVLVEHEDDKLWLAEALVGKVFGSHAEHAKVLRRAKGRELLGWHYRPLYTFLPITDDYCYVVPGDFVSTEDGTGLVHIAPAFGADDMEVGRKYNLPTLMTVDAQGRFIDAVGPWRGIFVKEADPLIQQELTQRGLMFKQGIYEHTYPFCWRCDTPLLYYARTTWYIKTTAFKERLLANNQQINWVPDHIRDGRFGEWLENNIDWGLARERYWGTPLPVLGVRQPGLRPQRVHWLGGRSQREDGAEVHEPPLSGAADEPLARSGPARPRAARPAPAGCGRADLALSQVRQRYSASRARGGGCLVRLRLDAGGAVALSLREQRDVHRAVPGRLHLRGNRPDARLVLHAACGQHVAV